MTALKKNMTFRQCQLFTEHTKLMTASFAASHPQVVPPSIQLCIALAQSTLLYDVQLEAHNKTSDWFMLKKIAEASPSGTTTGKWVRELACIQVIVSRKVLSGHNISVFLPN